MNKFIIILALITICIISIKNDYVRPTIKGCYSDNIFRPAFEIIKKSKSMSIDICANLCWNRTKYGSVQSFRKSFYCGCGNSTIYREKKTQDCSKQCPANRSQICGSSFRSTIFEIHFVNSNITDNLTDYYETTEEPETPSSSDLDMNDAESIANLLIETSDVNNCLSNCSNNGHCKVNNDGLYICSCFDNFAGSNCELEIRPCSSKQCFNGGECYENKTISGNSIIYDYGCDCPTNYGGKRCETMFDVCANKTCSSQGTCFLNTSLNIAQCKCFQYYSGDNCENKSGEIIAIKTTVKGSAAIAIIIIIFTYSVFILVDVGHLIEKPKIKPTIHFIHKEDKQNDIKSIEDLDVEQKDEVDLN
ncbi:unnamed protein product [Brachionus calyciflorus]|uniref:Uncharacterized protein n=1 Tax=Brachionus calyciflorus TaxID=104777 RepID=A0A813U397_9BILA|nr:unnamed protein product [Brachionus calyciflorus]